MSLSRENLHRSRSTTISNKSSAIEDSHWDVDWKKALELGMGQASSEDINLQKKWSHLCQSMRDLCPETSWHFISQESHKNLTLESLQGLNQWLKRLIAVPQWPFPKQVIIASYSGQTQYGWRLMVPGMNKANFYTAAPVGLLLVPYKDKHSAGWTILVQDSHLLNKAGQA